MLFFELLQVAVGNRVALTTNPTTAEWKEMFSLSKKQALMGIVFLGIEQLPKEQRPPKDLLMLWYTSVLQIKRMNDDLNRKSLAVANRFLHDGFHSVILKGQGIARLYPKGEYRTPGDIDIWVNGKRNKIVGYIRSFAPNSKPLYHHIDFVPTDGTEVEVHITPSWMNSFFTNKTLQGFFNISAEEIFGKEAQDICSDNGVETYKDLPIPQLNFNRVFILVHIYRHLFGEGIGLRQMLDYYYVLKQGFTEEERKETLDVLKSLKMQRFASAAMWVQKEVFGMQDSFMLTTPDEKEGRFLLNEIMLAGNFGHYDERIKRVANESMLHVFCRRVKRNFRFVHSYPSEVLWTPVFKVWHTLWRQWQA